MGAATTSHEVLSRLGGVATVTELVAACGRNALRHGVDDGSVVRVGRGRYAGPEVPEPRRLTYALSGVVSHLSAAVQHGWRVKQAPTELWVTVPRKHRVRTPIPGTQIRWADVSAAELTTGVTSPLRTVLDCARVLPFDEGLAVADSALRSGLVSARRLRAAAARARGPGSIQIRRVAAHADGRAQNPLESVLRSLALAAGLDLTPQTVVAEPGFFAIADLGDVRLRLVVEADGFEHHGTREALRSDCARHTGFALHGWTSLRFTYEDIMLSPSWVIWVLRTWRTGETSSPPRRAKAWASSMSSSTGEPTPSTLASG